MGLIFVFLVMAATVMPARAMGLQVEAIPERVMPGEAYMVRVTGTEIRPLVKVAGLSEPVPMVPCGADCMVGIAAVAMDAKVRQVVITVIAGAEERTLRLGVGKVKWPVEHLAVKKEKVVLSPKDERRANAEQDRMKAIYAASSFPVEGWGRFVMPVEDRITLAFGTRRIFNNRKTSIHRAIDIRGAIGTPVHAMGRGRVVLTGDMFFGGGTVIIDHGQGVMSTYMHLQERLVSEGDRVDTAQVIGLVGATGRVTGPHLHLGVKIRGIDVSAQSLVRLPL